MIGVICGCLSKDGRIYFLETPIMDEVLAASTPSDIATGLFTALNNHDVRGVVSYYASSYCGRDVAAARPHKGHQSLHESLTTYLTAFPDIYFQPEEVICEGNQVVVLWTATGTHRGPIMHIPPGGRKIEVRGVTVLTIEKGSIVDGEYIWDVAGMLRAIGLLPDLT